MLTVPGSQTNESHGVSRRSFLRIGGLALGGLSLSQILRAEASTGRSEKAIIMILLPGGPSHLDMYDLKPEAPAEIRGEFKPIKTCVPGIEICELMPRVASLMHKMVVLRSLVGAINDHNLHQCMTGWESHPQERDSPRVPGYPKGGWPSISAVLSHVYGPRDTAVPSSISLVPTGGVDITRADPGLSGYLGAAHSAFEPNEAARDDFVLNGVTLDRLADRRTLLTGLDNFRRKASSSVVTESVDSFTRQALEVLTSRRLVEALDLGREDPRVRARYGITGSSASVRGGGKLLEQFLLARRVVEAGARCVTLAFSRWPLGRMSKGDYNWDWHSNNFEEARATLPLLDQGVAALVEDLDARGLLDDVSVVVWGEFGRTPKINRSAGRDHWPQVAGALLAGGGLRTGQVIGATNRFGEYASERPVHFREVFATLYHQMGIDVSRLTFDDLSGRPQFLVDRDPISELI